MEYRVINFQEKLAKINKHWTPKIIAQLNDYHFKLVKFQGEFVWHSHTDTDEVFIVLGGQMTLEFAKGKVKLSEGEMFVVPKGVEHRPVASQECQALVIEPAGTLNTGNAGGDLTVTEPEWI